MNSNPFQFGLSPASCATAARVSGASRKPSCCSRKSNDFTSGIRPAFFASRTIPRVPRIGSFHRSATFRAWPSSRISSGSSDCSPRVWTSDSPGPKFAVATDGGVDGAGRNSIQGNCLRSGRSIPNIAPWSSSSKTARGTTTRKASCSRSDSWRSWCKYCRGDVLQITSGKWRLPCQFFHAQAECIDIELRQACQKDRPWHSGQMRRSARRQFADFVQLHGRRHADFALHGIPRQIQRRECIVRNLNDELAHVDSPRKADGLRHSSRKPIILDALSCDQVQ